MDINAVVITDKTENLTGGLTRKASSWNWLLLINNQ